MHGLGNSTLFLFKIRTAILIPVNEQLRYSLSITAVPSHLGLARHNVSPFKFVTLPSRKGIVQHRVIFLKGSDLE